MVTASSGYADVNGLHLYYELHGSGIPLVLLHGGMLTIDLSFADLIPLLVDKHQVIAVELQGHGRTADIDREIRPRTARPMWWHCSITWASTGRTSSATAWVRPPQWNLP